MRARSRSIRPAHQGCTAVAGEARPGSKPEVDHDGQATIRALGWFDQRDLSGWEPSVYETRDTADQLLRLRAALGYVHGAQAGPVDSVGL